MNGTESDAAAISAGLANEEKLMLLALIEHYGDFEEIWIGPALRSIARTHSQDISFPKRAVKRLEQEGVLDVVLRDGRDGKNDYRVILLNEHHPWVIDARAGVL